MQLVLLAAIASQVVPRALSLNDQSITEWFSRNGDGNMPPNDQTKVTQDLNNQIGQSDKGVFQGGKGILVRTPDFFSGVVNSSGGGEMVVPATFLVNDIGAPNAVYPGGGNPWCPHGSTDGFDSIDWSQCHFPDGPWSYAVMAAVVGYDGMKKLFMDFDTIQSTDWGYGVFYATDSNSADQRCRNLASLGGFDCPGMWIPYKGDPVPDSNKKGAGFYPAGNPYAQGGGGGAGCHFDKNKKVIDQTDAWVNGQNLVADADCQCNYVFKNNWQHWVDDWIQNTKQKPGFEWRSWLAGGGGRAPAWGVDVAACWLNNPRDMIQLQNALWNTHTKWLNGEAPQWSNDNPHPYWGWNEVPVDRSIVESPLNWDAVMIKLPAGTNSLNQLSSNAQSQLAQDMASWEKAGKLVPGRPASRPGSYVVVLRELRKENSELWWRQFYCENWKSPNGWYEIIFNPAQDACFIEKPGAETHDKVIV